MICESSGFNSLLGLGERAQLGLFTVPNEPGELIYLEAVYDQPIGRNGTTLSLSGSFTKVDESHESDGRDVESSARRLSARIWHPLIRTRDENLWAIGTFDVRDVDEEDAKVTTAKDRLRVLRAAANYTRSDNLDGTTFLTLEVSQGLDILGASDKGSDRLSRVGGRSDFTKVALKASREQGLGRDFGIQLAVVGQKSLQRLLSSEEFAYGGSQFGRAYDFSEMTGEDGIAGSAELRYGKDINAGWLEAFQLYAFSDVGAVWNDVPNVGTVRDSLASVGVGVRLTAIHGLGGTLEAGKPLTAFDSTTHREDVRVSFFLTAGF